MNILKIALATALIAGSASVASAQDGGAYGNLGVKTYEFDTLNILARLGYNFNQYIGVEVEGSVGIVGDDDEVFGIQTEVDTEWDIGAYAVARYPLTERFDIFARAGYTNTRVEVSVENDSDSFSLDGFAVGGGAQYNWDGKNGIRLGYTFNEADGADFNVIDLSYVRKF